MLRGITNSQKENDVHQQSHGIATALAAVSKCQGCVRGGVELRHCAFTSPSSESRYSSIDTCIQNKRCFQIIYSLNMNVMGIVAFLFQIMLR